MSTCSPKHTLFPVVRMSLNAMFVALYVVLSVVLSIPLGGLKLTFEALPVIICATAFSPLDAVVVGFLGELLNQLLTFGFTPTTVLWILPIVVRGLFIGLCVSGMKKRMSLDTVLKSKYTALYVLICIVGALFHSCINTLAFYVDSKMFGYYSYAAVFGVFWIRLAASVLSAALMAAATAPIVLALRRTKLIPERKKQA